jgi:hypothetical protein
MASTVYIPASSGGGFTPPVSISVKTASYTIPAGRYAKVYTECDSGGIFTINAVNAVVTAAFVNIDLTNSNISQQVTYTVPSNYKADVSFYTTSGNTYITSGNNAVGISPSGSMINLPLGPGGSLVAQRDTNSFASVTGNATPSNATNRQATFTVPTGTVISGSGNWKAVVEEYTV